MGINRLTLPWIFVILAGACFGADDATPKLPASDQALLDKALDSNLATPLKAYDAYQKALGDAVGKTVKELERLKADAMKKNNLPFAVVIDTKIKDVQGGGLADRVTGKGKASELLGNEKGGLVIISAKFGNGSKWIDVTEAVKNQVGNDSLNTVSAGWGIADPVPGVRKTTTIEYCLFGVTKKISVLDQEEIKINVKK